MANEAEKNSAEKVCAASAECGEEDAFPLFPTVNYLSRLGKEHFRSTLKAHGLYPGQEDILAFILEEDGIKPQELANRLSVSLASVSVSLGRLEKAGFIIRKPDEHDKRTCHIYPSEIVEPVLRDIHTQLCGYENKLLAGLTEEEKNEFRRIADKLIYGACGVEDYSHKHPSVHMKEA